MGHRWQRDYNRAARMPTDVIRDAGSYLVEVFAFLLLVAIVGIIISVMGWGVDD